MPRLTKKYKGACETLGLPIDAGLPHEAVYGMLALHGFEWDGEKWRQQNEGVNRKSGSLRVSADPDVAGQLTDAIAYIIAEIGLTTTNIRGPYPDRKSKKERWYITFDYLTK